MTKPPATSTSDGERRPAGDWRTTIRPGDTYDWQVTLTLPLLTKPYIHNEYEEPDLRTSGPRKRRQYLKEIGGFGEAPSPADAKAIEFLLANEPAIYGKILPAIAEYSAIFRPDWEERHGTRTADLLAPLSMTPSQVAQRIEVRSIVVGNKSREGVAYIEIHGECAWDREHGFAVALHRDRIVAVNQQGTGWTDPAANKGS